jgi:hypothetical protein
MPTMFYSVAFAVAVALTVALAVQAPTAPAADPPYRLTVDPLTVTLIGGMIVTVISAIVTGVVSIITAIQVKAAKDQQAQNGERIVTVVASTKAIEGHVNSEKTAAQGREVALQQENKMLREMVAEKANTAALLAQAAAGRASSRSTDPPAATAAPLPVEIMNPAPVPVVETGGHA